MRIALVGGVERNETTLQRLAESHGHRLDYHGGHMKGRGVDEMDRFVSRADVVIVSTDVNSHTAVMYARKAARRLNRELILVRNCNPTRFSELLTELEARKAA